MATLLTTTTAAAFPLTNQTQQQQAPAPVTQQAPVPANAWTNETFADAEARHEFITVGIPNRNRLTIQDAYDIWAANPAVLFQTGYRIAGTREDITAALQAAQFTDEEITAALDSAVSGENYTGVIPDELHRDMAPEFHNEMFKYITWNRTAVKTNTTAPGNTFFNTMTALNPALLGNTQAKPRTVATGGPGRKVEAIQQKLQKATYDKPYLDVSNMDDFGRKTKWVAPGSLAGRVGTARIPIVSNKLDRYIAAINMIPGGAQMYAEDIAEVTRMLGGSAGAVTAFPQPGQQVPNTMTGAPAMPTNTQGFQPFAPQQPQGITPVAVGAILTAKQRKQRAAAAAQVPNRPNFATALTQPMAFPGQVVGRPMNFGNIPGLNDEDYDDDDDEEGYYDNVAPVNFVTQGFPPQQQQFAPQQQQQQFAPQQQQQQQQFAPQQQQFAPQQQQFAPRPISQFPQQQFAPAPAFQGFPQNNFNRPPTAPQQQPQFPPAPRPIAAVPQQPQFPNAPRPIVPQPRTPPVVPVAPVNVVQPRTPTAIVPVAGQQAQTQAQAETPLM